ncbi:unknown protein [Seminavis robusta]|uniref:Uncharacterized protein n=1 Tax=Seminavis robusta TaxID=568900 RepID=A0A9N8HBH6_9STRA|nr:unknown protein [Seminavis robusta]|eukprot:Sro277_g106280.1 n/a (277) ;mRNA; f:35805-36771
MRHGPRRRSSRRPGNEDRANSAMAFLTIVAPNSNKERELIEYAQAVMARGVDPNDNYDHLGWEISRVGRSAVGAAAAYGYTQLLIFLVAQANCSVTSGYNHALYYAVRAREYESMTALFDHRGEDICSMWKNHSDDKCAFWARAIWFMAIKRRDVKAVWILRQRGKATFSYHSLGSSTMARTIKSFLQRQLYPDTNVLSWSKTLHWSFPVTDRQMINWLWYHVRPSIDDLPEDAWLTIFSFVGRDWWGGKIALRECSEAGGMAWRKLSTEERNLSG